MIGLRAEKGKPTLCFRALQKRGKMVTWKKKKKPAHFDTVISLQGKNV